MISSRSKAIVFGLLLVGSVLGGGVTITEPVAAVQDTVTIHDAVGGTQISVASDGQEVFVNASDGGTTTGGNVTVSVTNSSGSSINVKLYDDGTSVDSSGNDGNYWGSFNVTSGATDDATDIITVAEGNDSSVTVDLDSGGDGGTANVTADYTAPSISSSTSKDANDDGEIETITVTFTEGINDTTLATADFSVDSPSRSVNSVSSGTTDDDTVNVTIATISNTSATPVVTLSAGGVEDAAGNSLGSSQEFTGTSDGAAPRLASAVTGDANHDGTVDRINVTFTEDVSDASLDAFDFSVAGGSVDAVGNPDGSDDAMANLTVSGLTSEDTQLTPDVTLASGNVTDLATSPNDGPRGSDQTRTAADGAAPVALGIALTDRDADGKVDASNVTFSESMNDTTFTPADWSINGTAAEAFDTLGSANDTAVQLRITTDSNEVDGTNVTGMNVTYTPGSVASANGESLGTVGNADVDEVDEAEPLITSFSASNPGGSEIDLSVASEEQLTTVEVTIATGGSTVKTVTGFTESGSGPYTYSASATVDSDGDYTVTLGNASDAAGNDGASGQSRSVSIDTSGSGGSADVSYSDDDESETSATPAETSSTPAVTSTKTTSSTPTSTRTSTPASTPASTTGTPPATPTRTEVTGGQPGFGAALAIAALLAAALLAVRRPA